MITTKPTVMALAMCIGLAIFSNRLLANVNVLIIGSIRNWGEKMLRMLVALATFGGLAHATVFIDTGFEGSTSLPAGWAQSQILGSATWNIQQGGGAGGTNPTTARSGTNNATLYVGNTGENKTRLTSPAFDTVGYTNLSLTFWHTQALWSPDQDQLKVFFSSDGGTNWTELAYYTTSVSAWTQRTLVIPSASANSRIAFEGNAKYGYGVCLDDIQVTGIPGSISEVSVSATDASASEVGPDPGTWTITRIGNTTGAVSVNFTLSGTATLSSDYTAAPSSPINFAAGETTKVVTLTPIDDMVGSEGNEVATLTLTSGTGYAIGTASDGISIYDDEGYDLNILVIGSTHSFSEGGESGVVHEKPFNPTTIASHLYQIIDQDPAISGSVNVQFEDIYKTKAQTVNYSGTSVHDFTSRCYSLAQHYLWPDGKTNRLANLRGQAGTQWDYIIICNDPYITANFPGMVAEGVKLIQGEVAKSPNPAQVVLLAQWPESSSTFTAAQFNEITYRVGNSAGLTVVPAGKVWDSYSSKDTNSNHPTPRGEYLAAASIYSKLYNRSAKTSAYDYPAVGDAIADHSLSVVQANAGVAQYSGTYTSFNPFQMKYLTKRVVSYRETGTSTEDRMAQALDRLDDVQRISLNTSGYAGVPGTRWDFNYGRGNDWWEDDKDYEVNSTIYDWVYGFPMHHYSTTSAPTTMPYGIDKHYDNGTTYEDGTDLGIPYNMIRPGTREPDAPEWVRAIPIRLMWQKMCEVSPGFNPLGDSTHMHPNLNDATAAFMYTLLSGRCPVEPEPAVATTSTTWMQWLGHKTGYETAWQMSHLTTRAPGLRVLPSATAATTITPTTTETMTVNFLNPPQSDVTVNVSISNANAAIVGSKQLVFTPQNYKTSQSVSVAGIPGSAASETFNVDFTTVSTDEVYNGISDSWGYTINRSTPVTLTRVDKTTIQTTAYQNLPVTINLNTTGASSSNTILAGPSRGTAVWSGSNVIYTPGSDFTGKDGFSFSTNNAGTLSVGYVEITVSASVPNGMVSYRGNGNEGGAVPVDSNTYAQNATVTISANTGNLTRTGYNFTGWNAAANGSGTNYNAGSTFSMGAGGMILYVKWTFVPTYTVTYNANASSTGVVPSSQIKTDGVDLTLAANIGTLAKNGYTFAGWNTLANGTGTTYAVGGIYSDNANITLYAKWTPNNYTVTFNPNGGVTPSPATKVVTYASTYGDLATVSYPGNTFNGWFTAATGGTQVQPTTTVTNASNHTLHAQWTLGSTYTISYNANGADTGSLPTDQSKLQNVTLVLDSNGGGLARTGYTFAGWNTAADSSGTPYAAGANYTANASVVLYAQWAGAGTYTVSYDGNLNGGGTVASSQTKLQGVGLALDTNSGNMTKTGFNFAGWNTVQNGTGTAYASGATYTADLAVTLYAQWNPVPVVNPGSVQSVEIGATIPWSPTEISPQLWLDADDTSTITLNGATVSQWADKSGFARHATALTTAQPTATVAGLNGKRVITFDGATDVLDVSLDFMAGVSHSAFIVTKPTIYSNIYGAANANAGANSLHVGFASATNYRMNYWSNDYGPVLTANFAAGSANLLNYVWSSGTSKQILANGKSEGTNASAGVIGTMSGGGRIGRTTGNAFFGGDIAEFVAVTGAVSQTDREKMEGYLAHKWGLAGSLAVGHPYENFPPGVTGVVVTLDGTATDTDALTYAWSVVSGPASVTFADASAIDTTVTFTVAGVYTLRLAANDGYGPVSEDTVITVYAAGSTSAVTYSGNGSTDGSVPVDASSPYTNGSTVTVLGNTGTLVRTGYTFNGWNTQADGFGTSYAPGATFAISSPTTLYAEWIANTYTVTFLPNGGTTPSPTNKQVTFGSTYGTLATTSRVGHTFDGWFTAASGGTEVTDVTSVAITDNQTLHAQWILTSVSVITNVSSSNVPEGATATFQVKLSAQPIGDTTVTVSRSLGDADISAQSGGSLTFTTGNWDTYQNVTLAAAMDADASNGSATITCTPSDPAYTAANITATEVDSETTLTVTSGGNGTTSPSGALIVATSAATAISATANGGYDFVNWTVTSGSATFGNASSAATTVTITAPATVRANFAIRQYTLTYTAGSGGTLSGVTPQTVNHGANGTQVTAVPNTGYSFVKWSDNVLTAARTDTAVTSNITVTAEFSANTYDVLFDANSGTTPEPASKQVTYGAPYGTLATTSRAGYTFNGWFTAASGGTQVNSGTTVTTAENHILYAQWTAGSYTVTFDANGGDVPNPTSKSVTYGSTYGALATTSRAGYTFSGWYTAASGGTQIMSSTAVAITSAQTLYAQWIVGVLLTWDANGTGTDQTNGGGAWEGTNLWWNGTSNANWQSGASARFGGLNTTGGAVTLAAQTTVENFTFNPFTGTYTLGTAGQAITLNSGIILNASAGAVTISSPITLGGAQSWTNNASSSVFLTVGDASSAPITNGGFTLTFNGTGNSRMFGNINGTGGIIKNGTGKVAIGGQSFPATIDHTYIGTTTINAGILQMQSNDIGTGNIEINGAVDSAVLSQYYGGTFTRDMGSSGGQMRITGGVSGFSTQGSGGSWGFTGTGSNPLVWGSTNFAPAEFILQASDANVNATGAFTNNIDLNGADRTIRSDQTGGTSGNGTFSGVISNTTGTAGLIKVGIGHHILSNTNTYNGSTTISAGVLTANSSGALGNGSATNTLIFNGGSLRAGGTITSPSTRAVTMTTTGIIDTNGQSISIAGNIGGTGGLIKNGTTTLALSGANNYGGTTTVNAGTLAITKEASLYNGSSGSWTAANINVKSGAGLTLSVDTTGAAGFTATNLSTLLGNISVANTAAQGMQAGTTLGIDTGASPATFTLGNAITDSAGFFGGVINLTKLSTGTLVLNQPNTYTGITTISAGTIQLSGSGVIPGPMINNGTLLVDRAANVGTDFLGYPMLIGSGSIVANTGATVTISSAASLQGNALNTTGAGSFILSGVTTPIFGGLSGATGNLATVISSGYAGVTNLTLNTPAGSTFTYGGVIANNAANLSLTKIGTGTQILQGANTYAGATFLNAGTLTLSGAAGSILNSAITLNGGGLTLTNADSDAEMALNRINNSADITSNGGTITYTNAGDASTRVFAETIGSVNLNRGQLNIVLTANKSAGSQTLSLAGLTQTGSTAAIAFSALGGMNTANEKIRVNGIATSTATNKIIGPWATVGTAANAQTDYAVYVSDGTNATIAGLGATSATSDTGWSTLWADTSNYNWANGTTGMSLSVTKNINTLRHTGGAETLTLASANLGTYGILNGVNSLLTIAATGTGALTLPTTTAGNLHVNTGSNSITISAPINNNTGALTLVKSGAGILTLSSATSNFSGGTIINAGTISVRHVNALGGSGANLIFNGTGSLELLPSPTGPLNLGTLTVSAGATATVYASAGSSSFNIATLTGSGKAAFDSGWGETIDIVNASAFTGNILIRTTSNAPGPTVKIRNLADTVGSSIQFQHAANNALAQTLELNGDSGPLTFTNRQIQILGSNAVAYTPTLTNNNTLATNKWVINTDLLNLGTADAAAKNLGLAGSNTGNNEFAGIISNGPAGGTLGVTKSGAGTWILSGMNNYTGITTVSAGTLEIGGSGTLGNGNYAGNISIASTSSGNLKYNSAADQILGGVISGAGALVKDNSGALTLTNANTYTGITTVSNGKLLINGSLSNTAVALNVSSGATLGGTGAVGRNVTIASGGKLEFDISTEAVSHNGLDISTGRSFGFAGASTLTITSASGASPGIYTLITGGNSITGVAPATVNLPAGWVATVAIVGNSLQLNVTSTGGPGPVHHFAISSITSLQTVGTAITGITITAQDATNQTATSFTGTVTLGGTAGITGTTANFVAGELSGVSVTPSLAGTSRTLTVNDGTSHTGSATFNVQTVFESWAGDSSLSGGDAGLGADPDGDGITNLQAFAFGTHPTAGRPSPVSYDLAGNVTPGIPAIKPGTPLTVGAPPFAAVFTRRKDHAAAGLAYEVQFSADLANWPPNAQEPTVVAAGGSGPVEAVSVPFPDTVQLQGGGSAAPKFFRVKVTGN